MPWDAQAQIKDTNAGRRYDDYVIGATGTRDFRERYYGLGDGYNDLTANPASQAALLQHQHEVGERGVREGGGGNQAYAGSTINRERSETRRSELALTSLKQQREAEQAQWAQEDREAKTKRQEEHDEAQAEAIDRAANAPLPSVPASGAGAHAKNKKGTKYGVSKGKKA